MKGLLFCASLVALVAIAVCDGPQSYLHDPNNVQNLKHIKEHMSEFMDDDETDDLGLTDQEAMEFHYFKLHDYDNNNKLDGLELAAAMTHFHDMNEKGPEAPAHGVAMEDDELVALVELILSEDDLNDDGYVDYYEFVLAQRRSGTAAPPVEGPNNL